MTDWIARFGTDRLLLAIAGAIFLLLAISVFFAGVTVYLRARNVSRSRLRERLEAEWEPLVIGALSGDVAESDVHASVSADDESFFIDYLLRFIDRFTGDERALVRRLAHPYLPRVVLQLEERRPERRARAVRTLVRLGLDAYDEQVVRALDDASLTVAMVAARSLASRENTAFAPQILARLHRFRQWNPIYLASMLSSMGSTVVPALRGMLADADADPLARRVAADALYDLDDIASAEDAATAAASSDDIELVAACIRLLSRIGQPKHASVARRALASANPLLRLRAAEALGTIGGEEDLLRLRAATDDESPWVALAAARALAESGGRGMLESMSAEDSARGTLAREMLEHVPGGP